MKTNFEGTAASFDSGLEGGLEVSAAPVEHDVTAGIALPEGVSAGHVGSTALNGGALDGGFGEAREPEGALALARPGDIGDSALFSDEETGKGDAPSPGDVPARHGLLSLFADHVEARDPDAAAAIRGFRDAPVSDGQQEGVATAMMCGKMSDLVGIEDPHSAVGGFFHDLGKLLPTAKLFETEYDRACDAWFEQHKGTLF